MQNVTLILGGIASCAVGVLGGIAADPTMRQPEWPDWRQRYRAMASAPARENVGASEFRPATGYHHDLGAAGSTVYLPAVIPWAAASMSEQILPEPDDANQIDAAARRDAAAVVTAALAQTDALTSTQRVWPESMRQEIGQAQFKNFAGRNAPDERIGWPKTGEFAEDLPAAATGRDRIVAGDGLAPLSSRPADESNGDEPAASASIHR